MFKKIFTWFKERAEEIQRQEKERIEKHDKEQKAKRVNDERERILAKVWHDAKQENMKLSMYHDSHNLLIEAFNNYRLSENHFNYMCGVVYYAYGLSWGSQGLIRNKQAMEFFKKCYDADPNHYDVVERLNQAVRRNNKYASDPEKNPTSLGMLMHGSGMNTEYFKNTPALFESMEDFERRRANYK